MSVLFVVESLIKEVLPLNHDTTFKNTKAKLTNEIHIMEAIVNPTVIRFHY